MKRIKMTLKTVFGLAGMYLLSGVIGAQGAVLTMPATPNPVNVSLPTQGISCKTTAVTVPVSVGDLTGKNVLAFDFEVRFNPAVLRPNGFAPTSNGGTLSNNFTITANPFLPGRLIVSGFGIYPLDGAGTLLNLNFELLGQPGAASPLTWQAFMLNEGDPASVTTNGLLTVRGSARVPKDRQNLISY